MYFLAFYSQYYTFHKLDHSLDFSNYFIIMFTFVNIEFSLEKSVSIEFTTIILLWTLEISIREKHHMLIRSVLSADKTPHTNEEEVYRYKVTARDVLSTIW